MILETVLLWYLEVVIPTLVLSDSDVPGPGGGGGGGVDVYGDGDTGGTGRNPHVLPGVVATDYGRRRKTGCSNYRIDRIDFLLIK